MENFNEYASKIVKGKELVEEIIFKLDKEIKNNPKSDKYGFAIDYFRIENVTVDKENFSCIENYYSKEFKVYFEDDEINKIQKIKLVRL